MWTAQLIHEASRIATEKLAWETIKAEELPISNQNAQLRDAASTQVSLASLAEKFRDVIRDLRCLRRLGSRRHYGVVRGRHESMEVHTGGPLL
jgi:hypothetical protein